MDFDTSSTNLSSVYIKNIFQEFLDVKQNYVYKGLNLNLKEIKELCLKVYQTEEQNRQITVNGLFVAYLDE